MANAELRTPFAQRLRRSYSELQTPNSKLPYLSIFGFSAFASPQMPMSNIQPKMFTRASNKVTSKRLKMAMLQKAMRKLK